MHWILKVTRIDERYAVLEGDAGEFVLSREHLPRALKVGHTVKLEHTVRHGRAHLDCRLLEPA